MVIANNEGRLTLIRTFIHTYRDDSVRTGTGTLPSDCSRKSCRSNSDCPRCDQQRCLGCPITRLPMKFLSGNATATKLLWQSVQEIEIS